MKRYLVASGVAVALAVLGTPSIMNPQVCAGLDSGKHDVVGDHKTVTVTAPAGFVITDYCVKAGSIQQGNGPVYVQLSEPVESITFGHPSGKDVSHWSVSWVPAPSPEPSPEPSVTPEPSVEPSSAPEPSPSPEPELAETGGDWVPGVMGALGGGALVAAGGALLWERARRREVALWVSGFGDGGPVSGSTDEGRK